MASHWLLPASVLVGSVLIALAIIAPTILSMEDAGTKARRDCEALLREGMPDTTQRERLVQVCVFRKAGLG
jgi:hypothetical protein